MECNYFAIQLSKLTGWRWIYERCLMAEGRVCQIGYYKTKDLVNDIPIMLLVINSNVKAIRRLM
jgi:hypothetical protein